MTAITSSSLSPRTTSKLRKLGTRLAGCGIGLCALLGVAAPAAAYDTYIIYLDGPHGGEIYVDGETQPPPGICGIRFYEPAAWYWGGGEGYDTEPMENLYNNGIDVDELWFSAPYEGCEQGDPPLFVVPAAQNGLPPIGALTLVVQVLPEDVEYLDFHLNPIPEAPEFPDPPDDDFCSLTPQFCEIPDDLAGELCILYPFLQVCREANPLNGILGRLPDPTHHFPQLILRARLAAEAGDPGTAYRQLGVVAERAALVTAQTTLFRGYQARLARIVNRDYPSEAASRTLAGMSASFELGAGWAERCGTEVAAAQRALDQRQRPDFDALGAVCSRVNEPLAHAETWLGRLHAWALPADAPR